LHENSPSTNLLMFTGVLALQYHSPWLRIELPRRLGA
jgi:hypothetical protein